MSACSKAGSAFCVVLLCTCLALSHAHAHGFKSDHDHSLTDRYAAVLHDASTTDAGVDLGDAKMTDLTSSIQGWFSMPQGTKKQHATPQPTKPKLPEATRARAVQTAGHELKPKDALQPKVVHPKDAVETKVVQAKAAVGATSITKVQARHVKVSIAEPAKQELPGKLGEVNVSTVVQPVNTTVEEAVVSLPMASFALGDAPQPVKNKTEPKFPGNSTQKAAWEEKEKSLEKEVQILKAQLANTSQSLESDKLHVKPATAAQPSSAQVHHAQPKQSEKFMAAKAEPKQDVAAKATDMTAATVVTASPKKVASILALDTVVDRAAVTDDQMLTQASLMQEPSWLSSFFAWLTGKPSPTLVSEIPVEPSHLASLPKATSRVWSKQSREKTAQATREEQNLNLFAVNDAWQQMEKDDAMTEDSVHREDVSERVRAETPELPHTAPKSELLGRHGVQMSGFWSKLENEDFNIEQTVRSDDLVAYAELTQAQDRRVSDASDALSDSTMMHMHHSQTQNHDMHLAIHEPWLRRELRDKAFEHQIHDSPDLQMLQLQHKHQRK